MAIWRYYPHGGYVHNEYGLLKRVVLWKSLLTSNLPPEQEGQYAGLREKSLNSVDRAWGAPIISHHCSVSILWCELIFWWVRGITLTSHKSDKWVKQWLVEQNPDSPAPPFGPTLNRGCTGTGRWEHLSNRTNQHVALLGGIVSLKKQTPQKTLPGPSPRLEWLMIIQKIYLMSCKQHLLENQATQCLLYLSSMSTPSMAFSSRFVYIL